MLFGQSNIQATSKGSDPHITLLKFHVTSHICFPFKGNQNGRKMSEVHGTVQSLYNTSHYNTDLDKRSHGAASKFLITKFRKELLNKGPSGPGPLT